MNSNQTILLIYLIFYLSIFMSLINIYFVYISIEFYISNHTCEIQQKTLKT